MPKLVGTVLSVRMQQVIIALPVLPGKMPVLKELIASLSGPKRNDFIASGKRHGVHKEAWFLHSTRQGDSILRYAEVDDIDKTFSSFASGTDPFDKWMNQQFTKISGVDFTHPSKVRLPEELLSYGY